MKKKSSYKIHSVKYNFVMNAILKASQYIFPLITLPYITRTLGSTNNGKVAFAASVISYFSMFAQLGIPSYAVRECAKCRDDQEKLTKTVQEILIINCISMFFSYIVFFTCIAVIGKFKEEAGLLLINSSLLFLNMLGMEWLYQAVEMYQYITFRNIAFKLISVILMFVLVHNPSDYALYAALVVFSSGGSYILNFFYSKRVLLNKTYYGQYEIKKHIKPIFTFFALSVTVSMYTSMDTVMLGFLSDDVQVAYYSLGTKIKIVLATSISALGPVLLPRITYCLNNGQAEKLKGYIYKSIHFVILTAIPVNIYFIAMSPCVIDILGGADYLPAISCMRIITLAIIPIGIGGVACSQILTPLGKERLTMYSTIYGAVANFLANIIFINIMGAAGAALATVIAESLIACIQIHYAWSEVVEAFQKLPYVTFAVSNIIAVIALMLFLHFIIINNSLGNMIVSCVLFFGTYFIMLLVFRDELIVQYGLKYLRKIVGRR
ncbi:MAG: flippase [Lachnospiraceae bacterium]|nr:flippase [Lachnospiraceae bacterium]